MRGPLHLARVDRATRRRIFCWRTDCLGQLAELAGEPTAAVRTLPGWVAEGNVWRETRRSQNRRARGKPPGLRRPVSYELAIRDGQVVEQPRSATNLLAGQAIFVCSACGALTLVDPARLVL